ncbi:hypothetical protein [Dictyobacter kobayashii]|uniref:Uncharacterized protein n=1 Tax=Dictyobacter kobayashii TaxID=2014872 RepID=A0A402ADX0_9CHLR|nr:hypothetical protein [Dictyobacter kobayashii]GCE17293.1 hypothetical protein KDK_10930 [Dictyobacter kobayashii]
MLDQNQTAIIIAVVSVISTIVGAIIATAGTYLTSRSVAKDEKNRRKREKIEEIYVLINQVYYCILAQAQGTQQFTGTEFTVYGEFFQKYQNASKDFNELPLDRISMLISFYAPSSKIYFKNFNMITQSIQMVLVYTIKNAEKEDFKTKFNDHADLIFRSYIEGRRLNVKIEELEIPDYDETIKGSYYLALMYRLFRYNYNCLQDSLVKHLDK